MKVTIRVIEKTSYVTKYSPAIVLRASAKTPEMARDLAQAWADVAVDESASFYKKGKTGLKTFVQDQFDTTKGALDTVYQAQRENEAAWDEDVAVTKLADKANKLTRFEEELADTLISIRATQKEIDELRVQLAAQDEKIVLWKSPPTTAIFLAEELKGDKGPGDSQGIEESAGYQEEQLNPTHLHIREKLVDAESQLEGLREKEQAILASIDLLSKETDALRERNARYRYEKKQLVLEADVFSRSYSLLADKLEQAKIAETEQKELADIKVVASAVLPDEKVAPKRTLIVAVAGLLGLGLTSLGAIVRYSLASDMQKSA